MDFDQQTKELMLQSPLARRLAGELEKEDLSMLPVLRVMDPFQDERYKNGDTGNAYLFAELYSDRIRYVKDRGAWYAYENGVWHKDHANARAMELCRRMARMMHLLSLAIEDENAYRTASQRVAKLYTFPARERLLKDAASVCPLTAQDFDADPWLFNCQNGVLNLRDGSFRDHRASDHFTRICGAAFNPDARCERWEQFVKQVMELPGQPAACLERAAYLQRALGYALTGDVREECLFIFCGASTRNGKGTLMETMTRMMGDYARTAQPETIAAKAFYNGGSQPSEDIARLHGARLLSVSEPDQRLVLSAALLKQMTGGDTVTARFLNENSFQFRPQFKLFISTNHLPGVSDMTLFSSGRIRLLRFERHFAPHEQDKTLKAFFAQPENLSAVLNWCLQGLAMYRENGLAEPADVNSAMESYRRESDFFGQFAAECLVHEPGARTRISHVYACYQQWCATNGADAENGRIFRKQLESHGYTLARMKPPGGTLTSIVKDTRLVAT